MIRSVETRNRKRGDSNAERSCNAGPDGRVSVQVVDARVHCLMSQRVHFISGLPRSGSTLLAGILRQNPDFQAAMSSPVAALMNATLEQTGAGNEFAPFFDEARRKVLCRALFDAYYKRESGKRVIFDTNRVWTARLHQLVELFDDFKVICRVRNPAWVMDSFERIYRKNPSHYRRIRRSTSCRPTCSQGAARCTSGSTLRAPQPASANARSSATDGGTPSIGATE